MKALFKPWVLWGTSGSVLGILWIIAFFVFQKVLPDDSENIYRFFMLVIFFGSLPFAVLGYVMTSAMGHYGPYFIGMFGGFIVMCFFYGVLLMFVYRLFKPFFTKN